MNKAYKFRMYPNSEQEVLINKTFGCVRFIYNKMLGDKIAYYEEHKAKLNTTPAQYKQEFEWLKEVDSLALCNAQLNLQTAYNNFFRDVKTGFPKFKSKHRDRNSYTTNNVNGSIRIEGKQIKLPKLGLVNVKFHRQVYSEYAIKSCTISKSPTGKYYISILVEYEAKIPHPTIDIDNLLGLDMDMWYVNSKSDRNYKVLALNSDGLR